MCIGLYRPFSFWLSIERTENKGSFVDCQILKDSFIVSYFSVEYGTRKRMSKTTKATTERQKSRRQSKSPAVQGRSTNESAQSPADKQHTNVSLPGCNDTIGMSLASSSAASATCMPLATIQQGT